MNDLIRREAVLELARSGQIISNSNFDKVCALINAIPADKAAERKIRTLERRSKKLEREASELLHEKHLMHGEIVRLRRMMEAEHDGGH